MCSRLVCQLKYRFICHCKCICRVHAPFISLLMTLPMYVLSIKKWNEILIILIIIIIIIDINLCRTGVVAFCKNRTRFIKEDYTGKSL
jgi:hypothetical protein